MEDKYVGILSSSSEEVNDNYKSIARGLSRYLAKSEFNLIFGGCSKSMMGICYQEFKNNNRNIYSVTTAKYQDDLNNLQDSKHILCETTFDLKKEIFENSDLIVVLPGGIGTYSEVLSFIEEKRSNDKDVPIEIYDEDGYYLPLIETLKIMVVNNFVDASIFDYFKVSHDYEEFKEHIESYLYNERGKRK